MNWTTNAVGRRVAMQLGGRDWLPFEGSLGRIPTGTRSGPPVRSCRDFPPNGDKRARDLRDALERAGLRDGMRVSTHHHFRDGDLTADQVFAVADAMGVRDLVWYPSAAFPCHARLLPYLQRGVIRAVEGSLNGVLGDWASEGRMGSPAVLRSHGGRYRAIQDGEVQIDVAVIAAPAADAFGNANGLSGPAACGPLGFALADSLYAHHVIVVTDHLVPFPCVPWHIQGNHVDQVVVLERIGDSDKIVSGTTRVTRSPERLRIAELAADFVVAAGLVRDGFSFQAGAGGTSLAFSSFLIDHLRTSGVRASFVRGGGTEVLVEMLRQGLTEVLLDGQCFDLAAVRSMATDSRHVATSPFTSYNYHGKGNFASMVDIAVLGATEIDMEFNANVVSHSDGRLRHGIGGWQDALFAQCSILAVPTFRNRLPILRESVTTLCAPGDRIDVVVTERGIAVNPLREDLLERVRGTSLTIRSLEDLRNEAERICGKPDPVPLSDDPVGVVTWVDGTVIDHVYRTAAC